MLIPREFAEETFVMADMSTYFLDGGHGYYFVVASVYIIGLTAIVPWIIFTKLRAEDVRTEKLERAWSQYVATGIDQWIYLEESPACTQNSRTSAIVKKSRDRVEKEILSDKTVQTKIRGQALEEMRFSLLSNKFHPRVSSWWFAWELFRKVLINLLFVLGQNKSYNFGW